MSEGRSESPTKDAEHDRERINSRCQSEKICSSAKWEIAKGSKFRSDGPTVRENPVSHSNVYKLNSVYPMKIREQGFDVGHIKLFVENVVQLLIRESQGIVINEKMFAKFAAKVFIIRNESIRDIEGSSIICWT